ncbi:hypothetical protein [Micromonospora sp. MH99]|uniref:hypothetical protein n=1 Tax=Micromonospora sp. MH99 TaxID=1945510 RepID=UPI001F249AF5|nr:hypothetical protein [Micromonospora sp. MH99]MCF0092535.1 hypothetical protein [Micromonospora sp. MH99]
MSHVRALWIAWSLLLSAVIGIVGGGLAWLNDEHPAKSIIAGATAFAATETLCLMILGFLLFGTDRPADKPRPHP